MREGWTYKSVEDIEKQLEECDFIISLCDSAIYRKKCYKEKCCYITKEKMGASLGRIAFGECKRVKISVGVEEVET